MVLLQHVIVEFRVGETAVEGVQGVVEAAWVPGRKLALLPSLCEDSIKPVVQRSGYFPGSRKGFHRSPGTGFP